jgi:hypothetical protein
MGLVIFYVLIMLLMLVSMWKVFTKAGKPGWAILVPIYNIIILLEIAGKPWWWIFLFMIPVVNFVIMIMVYIEIAKAFGKSSGFAIGLLFFSIIFWPILAFGDAQYVGTGAQA